MLCGNHRFYSKKTEHCILAVSTPGTTASLWTIKTHRRILHKSRRKTPTTNQPSFSDESVRESRKMFVNEIYDMAISNKMWVVVPLTHIPYSLFLILIQNDFILVLDGEESVLKISNIIIIVHTLYKH